MDLMDVNELKNMVYLLDDSDDRVVSRIEEKIFSFGLNSIPFLESLWPDEESAVRQERIVNLIKRIKQNVLAEELRSWLNSDEQDLMDGVFIINKILDPNLDRQSIENQLDKIKLDAWLELNYDLTSFEKVKILNRIIFDVHKFTGDTETYHHSKNSFLSSVLERKKGNPISLAIIYSIVAQRLNIPIYGVNLPQHFILGYVKDLEWPPLLRFNDESLSRESQYNDILFYINPFNNGLIFNQENIHKFLKQLKLEVKEDYFKICENRDIIIRILRNLEVSFSKENNHSKKDQVMNLIKIMMRED
ncbi:MAG: transglutaminase-like domain-containing protein [Bacteroidia bacterium]|nr:transglutaminase-like domain-containing protein [Bacteroidia bacterium]